MKRVIFDGLYFLRSVDARNVLAACALMLLGMLPQAAIAQAGYPSRAITLSAGFAPGGPTDTVARAIAQKLATVLGKPVVVENRPGADGRIQLQQLAKAAPDGHQIGLADSGLIINALLYKTPPYDALKDFTPITYIGEMPNFIAVSDSLNVNNLKEFLEYAKTRPGKLNYGATASSTILATEMLTDITNMTVERVRYRGAAAAIPALVTGEIHLMVSAAGTLAPMAKQGRIKALAVTAKQRSPLMPEVPTTAEAGLPEYTFVNWYVLVGPANMPPAVVERLNTALTQVLADPELISQLARMGVAVEPSSGAKLVNFLKSDLQKIDQIITKANLRTE